ncbi:MAG TPA: AraC family transcriptional regulator [Chitinophagaceae bacterium]|nr:AraC family transcriptional regulator [Chitinophagaceae bacterium]HCT22626.1 AraC family transcriptional regulator [Chitinophagaceae bacterium]
MLLKDFTPAADISDYVQLLRIVHLQFDANQPLPFKAYPPRPEHCLAFYPYDTESITYASDGREVKDVPVVLYGQFSEVTNRFIGANFLVVQVIFWPGAIYRLTGIPADELTNTYADASYFIQGDLQQVNELLRAAKDYTTMLSIVQDFVRSLIRKEKKSRLPIDDAFAILLSSPHQMSMDNIAREACLSVRQLERRFKERTGINPKLYQRIIRFDRAFRLKNTYPHLDWLRIAMECGYHDHQHLAKEYKDLTGLSPNAFHEIEERAPERHFGLNEGYYQAD